MIENNHGILRELLVLVRDSNRIPSEHTCSSLPCEVICNVTFIGQVLPCLEHWVAFH